jgi:KUP system potassium uptake protein
MPVVVSAVYLALAPSIRLYGSPLNFPHWMAHKVSENPTLDAGDAVRQSPQGKLPILALSALGIVFGDIGTSPLYTFKTILGTAEAPSDAGTVLGALALVLWTLFIITTVKYVSFAMRVDNDGEGGILALMALLGVKKRQRPTIVAVGLFGAALIYGDGAITPAISVLSALEGLNMATPALQPYVVPAAVAILLALFAIQSQGTAAIGHLFGPVMLSWFVAIAAMGIAGIVRHPSVFAALNPAYGLSYLFTHGATGFLVLGAVFLCAPAPRRCMPIWAISAGGLSNLPGSPSSFQA